MPKLRVIPGGRSDDAEFERLIAPHLAVLYRAAYRFTRNAADAEDLVQDVCIRGFLKRADLEGMESPRAWLLRVQYRLFIDGARRRKSAPSTAMSELPEEIAACEMPSEEPGPDVQADSVLAERRLERAWRHLDNVQQALLALHDIEGYSLIELEGMTGLPQGTLKSRLHRARVRLGRLLQRESLCGMTLASGQEG